MLATGPTDQNPSKNHTKITEKSQKNHSESVARSMTQSGLESRNPRIECHCFCPLSRCVDAVEGIKKSQKNHSESIVRSVAPSWLGLQTAKQNHVVSPQSRLVRDLKGSFVSLVIAWSPDVCKSVRLILYCKHASVHKPIKPISIHCTLDNCWLPKQWF